MGFNEDTKKASIIGKYFPAPVDAPESDLRLIDIVRWVILNSGHVRLNILTWGISLKTLCDFLKKRLHESELVQISCQENQTSCGVTVIPICLVDREDSIFQIELEQSYL